MSTIPALNIKIGVNPPLDVDIGVLDRSNLLKLEYEQRLCKQQQKAMYVCQKWTGSPCETAQQIMPMLEKYAELAALRKHTAEGIPNKYRDDYDDLDDYRKDGLMYWRNLNYYPAAFSAVPHTTVADIHKFSTFHWALCMANNVCAERKGTGIGEPNIYNDVRVHFVGMGKIGITEMFDIMNYRRDVSRNLDRMQANAISKADAVNNPPKGWFW